MRTLVLVVLLVACQYDDSTVNCVRIGGTWHVPEGKARHEGWCVKAHADTSDAGPQDAGEDQ